MPVKPKPKTTPEQDAAATKKKLAELYALAGYKKGETPSSSAPKATPAPKPSMMDNLGSLGSSMARGAKRMVDQRKIIADEPKPKKK